MAETMAASSGSEEECTEPTMMVNRDLTPADVAAVVDNGRDGEWGCGCAPAF